MIQRVIKSGHSLAVVVPSSFVRSLGVNKGDEVRVERRVDRGTVTFHFKGATQLLINENVFRSPRKKPAKKDEK